MGATTGLGELKRKDPKSVWPLEASDFTPWLAENLDNLGAKLGLELELVEREAAAGDFRLDLLTRDLGTGRHVVIENQLDTTDHGHLGKLLTYASHFEASMVVWICPSFRDEHQRTLDWLNRMTSDEVSFFGVVVEVLQIDDSRPAVNFRVAASPAEWRQTSRRGRSQSSARGEAYRDFFQRLLDELREKHRFTRARAAQPQNWYTFSSGVPGIGFGASFALGGKARAEVYIDTSDEERNSRVLGLLEADREVIEAAFEDDVSWEALDGKRACRIAVYKDGSITDSSQHLEVIHAWMVESLLRFKKVVGPRAKKACAATA